MAYRPIDSEDLYTEMTYGGDVGVWKVVFWISQKQRRFSHPGVTNQEHLHCDEQQENLGDRDKEDDGDNRDDDHDGEDTLKR